MNDTHARKTSFGYRFAMIHRLHAALSKDAMGALGITSAQFPFLAELFHRRGPTTQDQLSRALCIDPAATARALDQLQKKGLVSREVNPENRRQKLVSVTPQARDLEEKFCTVLSTASDILVEGLSAVEKEAALTLLDRIMENAMRARYGAKG